MSKENLQNSEISPETKESEGTKKEKLDQLKKNTKEKLQELIATAGVIGIVLTGADAMAKEKIDNWQDLQDKLDKLGSGEQIQVALSQEKLEDLKPKIQNEGFTIEKKGENIVTIKNPSFEDAFGGMEETAEEEVKESEEELAQSEKALEEQRQETEEQRQETEEQRQETEEQMKRTTKIIEKEMEMTLATVEEKELKKNIVENINSLVEKIKKDEEIKNRELDEILNMLETLHTKHGNFKEENKEGLSIVVDFLHMRVERKGDSPEIQKKLNKLKEIENKIKQSGTKMG